MKLVSYFYRCITVSLYTGILKIYMEKVITLTFYENRFCEELFQAVLPNFCKWLILSKDCKLDTPTPLSSILHNFHGRKYVRVRDFFWPAYKSNRTCSLKKDALKNFVKYTRKHLWRTLFLIHLQACCLKFSRMVDTKLGFTA